MKVQQLDIMGFRSLKDVTWMPGDLNVVIGPNGSGKSNLLRFLELISVSARGGLSKYILSQGGMEPLVWDGQIDEISFGLKVSETGETPSPNFDYNVLLHRLGKTSAYRIMEELLLSFQLNAEEQEETLALLRRHDLIAELYDERGGISRTALQEPLGGVETFLSLSTGPFSSLRLLQFQKFLDAWAIYQDVCVSQEATIRQPTVARMENTVSADGQNLIAVLHTLYTGDRYFKQDVNAAMRAAFGNDFDELIFPPAADQRVQLRVRWKTLSREQSAADLSDGTLRFLFLLAVLASPSPAPLIAIDEPETGLHPSMLPIVAEYAVDASRRTQVILTTHSDQFLDAFRETKPTTTVAKWADGETSLTTLDGGELDYWLKDYTLGNLFRSGELENMA